MWLSHGMNYSFAKNMQQLFYKPFISFFSSTAKVVKDLSSESSSEKSCNHATKDGKNAIP